VCVCLCVCVRARVRIFSLYTIIHTLSRVCVALCLWHYASPYIIYHVCACVCVCYMMCVCVLYDVVYYIERCTVPMHGRQHSWCRVRVCTCVRFMCVCVCLCMVGSTHGVGSLEAEQVRTSSQHGLFHARACVCLCVCVCVRT